MRKFLWVSLVIAGFASVACATQVAPATPTIRPQPTAIAPSPAASDLIITLDDNNKSFDLHPGEHFLVKLGEGNYSVSSGDEAVVSRVPNISVVRGAQGVYEARKPGKAILTAAVGPDCPPNQICPQYLRVVLTVTLIVQ
jgi:hypothetical protein